MFYLRTPGAPLAPPPRSRRTVLTKELKHGCAAFEYIEAILQSREMMDLVLPVMRADLQ